MKNKITLNDIISFENSFKSSVNLYLSLNKAEKILGYIPTKSSVSILGEYLESAITNKEQASLLIGPYGKGKSHLILVLLGILSMDRNDENNRAILSLIEKIEKVDEIGSRIAKLATSAWNGKKYLPVLVTNTSNDLNQAFLYSLNDALKRAGLQDVSPDTYYTVALSRIQDWKTNYPDTYSAFSNTLAERELSIHDICANLKLCLKEALDVFTEIYPEVTAGSKFNPMAVSDVLTLYKGVSEKLVEEYGYSGIYIVFDEFSKYIESQDGTSAGNNMKLVQDLCELATNSKDAKVFMTLVAHKSIKEYGRYLSQDIINSFTGIEGRLIEKYFITSSKNNYELIRNAIVKDDSKLIDIPFYEKYLGQKARDNYYQLPAFKTNFSLTDFESIVLKGCYPLNPIAAYLLLNISEKVAQNERTLFTFISNDEPNSMARFVANHSADSNWGIGADLIYDYFESLFKKEVINEHIHNVWLSTEYVIEKCTSECQKRIAKAIAIVLIVNKEDEIPATEKYLSLCLSSDEVAQEISKMEESNLIYKKSSTGTYVFKTRAGVELKTEIKKQRILKGDNVDYAKALEDISGKHYVIPRKYNSLQMMTRYFVNQYMTVEDFLSIVSSSALLSDCNADGKVITLFSFEKIDQAVVKKHCEALRCNKLVVVCPKDYISMQKQFRDYEIIQELKQNATFTNNNEILKRELPLMLDDITAEIENTLISIYSNDSTMIFYYSSGVLKIASSNQEEMIVNDCCEEIYYKTAIVNNELVNRRIISTSQTRKARINIIQAILDHTNNEEFYSGSNQEATVYRSLFCQTGIQTNTLDDGIKSIINEINRFIDSCCDSRGSLSTLISILVNEPYGFRMGLIPFYLAYVLAERKEDIIAYYSGKEVQINADMIVNMCEQHEDYALYVSSEDIQKEKYISDLNLLFSVEESRNLSANRIKNIIICMQRWFRALPQVSRNCVCIDEYASENSKYMKSVKRLLQKVDFNSYEILFDELPNSFETESLEHVFEILALCKNSFDNYYDWIQNKITDEIYAIWGGRRKKDLYRLLSDWYEKQSSKSKQGLYDGRVTNFMSCISSLNVFSDDDITQKIAKAVVDVHLENWNTDSVDEFVKNLSELKSLVESIKDTDSNDGMRLTFTSKSGEVIEKMYSHAEEGTGVVLKNILEDTLDEYDDLSVNDRVSILLEMIEKIIK